MQHFGLRQGIDRLPAAAALACLLGEGAMTLIVLGLGQLARRRRARG